MSYSNNDVTRTAFPMLDFMLHMQRVGLQAMSLYQPMAFGALLGRPASERGAHAGFRSSASARTSQTEDEAQERVLAVGEEVLNVGTRMVPGKTTRIRRIVVQTPVEQEVTLHSETVVLERRKPIGIVDGNVLSEVTIEMSDFSEVPVVSKGVRLVEEVLLRKEVTARTETIRDTLKRDKLEVEQPSQRPALFSPPQKRDEVSVDARDRSGHDASRSQAVGAAGFGAEPTTDRKAALEQTSPLQHNPSPQHNLSPEHKSVPEQKLASATEQKPVPQADQKHGAPSSVKR
jgi:stress response protein YsnF